MASASPPRDLLHFTQPADHVPLRHRIDPQRFGLFPPPPRWSHLPKSSWEKSSIYRLIISEVDMSKSSAFYSTESIAQYCGISDVRRQAAARAVSSSMPPRAVSSAWPAGRSQGEAVTTARFLHSRSSWSALFFFFSFPLMKALGCSWVPSRSQSQSSLRVQYLKGPTDRTVSCNTWALGWKGVIKTQATTLSF